MIKLKILLHRIKNIFIRKIKIINFFLRYEIRVWLISRRIIKNRNKFLFIDCGSNLGQGFNFFKKYFTLDIFDYILIEPNPNCVKELEKLSNEKITVIPKGVWSSETIIKFYGINETNNPYTLGGSLMENHNSSRYKTNKNESLQINTISLSKLLKEKKQNYDVIIVKIDIESSEYEVLPNLIKDKSIDLIDHLFVEFHSEYFDIKERYKYIKLEKELIRVIKSKKIGLTRWI